ncbi:MAG: hypothetical protein ABFS41_17190 [Myxococcota bacterium]
MIRARAAAWVALAGALCLLAWAALAYVPPAERIARAVAETNRALGRARTLELRVSLEREDGEELAFGSLLTDPNGGARLEVKHASGFVERQLRRGKALEASRDGSRIESPHPLLAPLSVLQAEHGAVLQSRIAELGGRPDAVALGHEGDHDCFVLGGKDAPASYWVDQESLEPVRIDLPGGVRYRLGAPRMHDGIQLPSTITIEAPGRSALRMSVSEARPSTAPPDAFDAAWLTR